MEKWLIRLAEKVILRKLKRTIDIDKKVNLINALTKLKQTQLELELNATERN